MNFNQGLFYGSLLTIGFSLGYVFREFIMRNTTRKVASLNPALKDKIDFEFWRREDEKEILRTHGIPEKRIKELYEE